MNLIDRIQHVEDLIQGMEIDFAADPGNLGLELSMISLKHHLDDLKNQAMQMISCAPADEHDAERLAHCIARHSKDA